MDSWFGVTSFSALRIANPANTPMPVGPISRCRQSPSTGVEMLITTWPWTRRNTNSVNSTIHDFVGSWQPFPVGAGDQARLVEQSQPWVTAHKISGLVMISWFLSDHPVLGSAPLSRSCPNSSQRSPWRTIKQIDGNERFFLPINSKAHRSSSVRIIHTDVIRSSAHIFIGAHTHATALPYVSTAVTGMCTDIAALLRSDCQYHQKTSQPVVC